MKKIHPVQQKLLDLLKANVDDPLTVRELQDLIGVSSPSVIQHHITKLVEKGFLRRNPSNPQDYQVLADNPEKNMAYLNVYGMAQCGPNGSVLDGNPIDRIKISSRVLGFSASEAFVVKAKGSSMLPKIHSGDLVIAKKTPVAEDGEVAVCVNNGEVLIKKIQKIVRSEDDIAYNLISLNHSQFSSFPASENFKVEGVVRGIISYKV